MPHTHRDLGQPSILVVDDQDANLLVLSKLFGREGFGDVRTTSDARTVVSMVEQREPDLILLDLMMPHLDGFEVMRRLKEIVPGEHYLPILVLTADTNRDARHRALLEGAMDFLTKPFDLTEVLQRARNLLYTRALHLQQQRQNDQLERLVAARTGDLADANLALEQANLDILTRLARAAEYRDDDTGEHTRRVGHLSWLTALELGLPAEVAELLLRAARLHDVGKIGIPDSILLKPGRLTDAEMTQMQTHCAIGAELLSGSDSPLLAMAESIARSHHERWDGSGYPAGLAAEAIPVEGRIVAVVDVFDALTHARPYKQPWSRDQAIELLVSERARHFDPEVVDAFLQVLDRLAPDEGEFHGTP